jgi:preprotein translocase subunit YajC
MPGGIATRVPSRKAGKPPGAREPLCHNSRRKKPGRRCLPPGRKDMDFFIAPALAQSATGSPAGTLTTILPLVLIFVVFYFLLIRPQTKRAKEHRQMVAGLKKEDEVVTNGGILGRISDIDENFVTLDIAPNVAIRVQRFQIAQLMPKGTFKGA